MSDLKRKNISDEDLEQVVGGVNGGVAVGNEQVNAESPAKKQKDDGSMAASAEFFSQMFDFWVSR